MGRGIVRKWDLIILAGIALVCAACLWAASRGQAERVTVRLDGQTVENIPLNRDGEYTLSTPYGENVLRVDDGRAYIVRADCPGRDCMKGTLSRPGDVIACLPHHLVIQVEGESGLDAVSH